MPTPGTAADALVRAAWLEARRVDLLPVPYLHLIFTVPRPIAAIALRNKRAVYDVLLRAAAALRDVAGHPGGCAGRAWQRRPGSP